MAGMSMPLMELTDDDHGPAWQQDLDQTWTVVQESEDGTLNVGQIVRAQHRRRRLQGHLGSVRRGMVRYLYVAVDMSRAMADTDLRPSRLEFSMDSLERFVPEYFDQNPLSNLGVLALRDSRCEKLSELSGDRSRHVDVCKGARYKPSGEVSLQNMLTVAVRSLKTVPAHASREVLVLFGSITSCDPGDLLETVEELVKEKVRVSIIGLSAAIHACQVICERTGGEYVVITDEHHYKEVLHAHTTPPPLTLDIKPNLIRMGFPQFARDTGPMPCVCHRDRAFTTQGFYCPQCCTKHCDLPVECRTCGLQLASSPHLARSLHHLFPIDPFLETRAAELSIADINRACAGCQTQLTFKGETDADALVFRCPHCRHLFCTDCDAFVRDVLYNCPGCLSQTLAYVGEEDAPT